jgi:hypothetical protein
MKAVKFFNLGKTQIGFNLGGSFNAFVAMNANGELLCLMGETKPYMPHGGRKTLKNIVDTCKEGETYYWKAYK